ncbi:MAG: GGDEF domain-containing protein [Shewanella sp.]|nr:GGDEF domain-containing protein [Shewanella sp.]MCF1432098.1 GGDEF domain-containing protein [Shewanella sp.]MCF1439068.1 GGDEF domain-containing protein [Shewanella sp.]MCF1458368.1 GGDEF domain-containing protein [Shewanella sp.]
MLPHTIETESSLLEYDSPQVNLVHWMHQCELLKRFYQAQEVIVIQHTARGDEVIVSASSDSQEFVAGTLLDDSCSILKKLIQSPIEGVHIDLSVAQIHDPSNPFHHYKNLLARPVLWPDSSLFGYLCVLGQDLDTQGDLAAHMMEPFQLLLQQELSLLCQHHQIESMSMRDLKSGMLNDLGFMMMAPRQLSLGRRFNAWAGVFVFELALTPELEERHHNLLGSILQNTVRTSDLAAHLTDTEFVILAFLDSEADMDTLVKRVRNKLYQLDETLELNVGYCFFSPDSTVRLANMLTLAKEAMHTHSTKQNPQQSKDDSL